MGIWESLQWTAEAGRAIGGAVQATGAAVGGTVQVVGTVAEKVGAGSSEGARRMKGAMPDRQGWGTIGRIAWRITDHALAEFTRPYTCNYAATPLPLLVIIIIIIITYYYCYEISIR